MNKLLDPKKKGWKHLRKHWKKYLLYGLAGFVVLLIVLFAWFSKDLPTPNNISKRSVSQSTKIYDRTGQILLYETGEQKRTIVKSDQISDNLKKATISVEDANFYHHIGFDPVALLHAVFQKITGQTVVMRGASTITQQYVKNALLDPNRSISRKIKELILSIELEVMYDKDEILAMYLNEIPYGNNIAGAEAAAKSYYGVSAKDLSVSQAATLAAIPKAPTYYSLWGTHTDKLIDRKNYVLDRMLATKAITKEQFDEAKAQDTTTINTAVRPRKDTMLAPHFAMYVIEKVAEEYGETKVQKEGLKIITTLDYEKQKIAEESLTAGTAKINQYGASNAAMTAIDPKTGQILAMVGSIDYFNTKIDGNVNVADSERQPGSSFKPFAYATAFKDKKYSPSTQIFDVPTDFGNYTPQNYNGRFNGPVSIRQALSNSLNIPAVKIMALAGIDEVLATAKDMGITTLNQRDRYGLSLVLGSGEVKPVEMAGAFGVFANAGVKHELNPIIKVSDSRGKTLYEYKADDDKGKEVLDPQIAYEISNILSDNASRALVFGTRSALAFTGKTIAAKTGTTSDFKDAWTVGYSKSIATAVWVGNNNATPMKKGADGSVIAAPMFHNFMNKVVSTDEPFDKPAGITDVAVDKMSNKLPSESSPETVTDIFASWQVPTEKDDIHVKVKVCKANGLLAPDDLAADLIEEKVFTNIHSEKPGSPNWENPVRAWAQAAGLNNLPPTEKCSADDAKPVVNITDPVNGASINGNTTITATASSSYSIKNVTFFVDDVSIGTVSESPYSMSYNFSVVGSHTISAEVTDLKDATSKTSINVTVVALDSTPPVISNLPTKSGATLTWTIDENSTGSIMYGPDPDAASPYSYANFFPVDVPTKSFAITTNGTMSHYFFRVKATDNSGNTSYSDQYQFN